jgi:preprotein translocase subunit YajC
MPMGGERITGTVTAVGVDRITVKTADGKEQTVLVSNQTRYRQGREDIQLEDLKPGDHVFIMGPAGSDNQITALMVRRVTQEEMQRFGAGGERAFGEIIAIGDNQLTLRSPRQGERVVKINEQTRFMKDGKPATLADLKVGDRVFAVGKEGNGQFTATRIMSGMMSRGQWRGRQQPPEGGPGPEGGPPPQ